MTICRRMLGIAAAASLHTLSAGFHTTPVAQPRRISALGSDARKTPFDKEVEELFAQYDADGNGVIDQQEFGAIVSRMKQSARRREIFSVATATFGSLLVASGSSTFQFGQKRLRGTYLEKAAEAAQQRYFPTALLSSDIDRAVARVLKPRGFTPANTLFGHSVCADEVNNRKEQLVPLLVNRWEEGFALGGLGGLPSAGKSGFSAFLHHVPDNGKLLVLFAPHVGIDDVGRVGALQRDGQAKVSSACGAAVGAYKALQEARKAKDDPLLVLEAENEREYDPQLKGIVKRLALRLEGIEDSADSIAFVTYQMYGIIKELILDEIAENKDLFNCATDIAVLGGIMINRRKGGDFFQPLSLTTQRKGEDPMDLFAEAFGAYPDMLPVMGSPAAMARASL